MIDDGTPRFFTSKDELERALAEANAEAKKIIPVCPASAFAIQHLLAAAMFSQMCGEVENATQNETTGEQYNQQAAYTSASVMLVIASLESNINEFLDDADTIFPNFPHQSNHSVLELMESKPMLEKYQYVLSFRGKEKYQKGLSPYQDVDALVKLRNTLVHFKPETEDKQEIQKKVVSRLKGRFDINPHYKDTGYFFPHQCMSYGCTKWAINVAIDFMKDFSVRADLPFRFEKFIKIINPEVI
jgi:hypothetical protein